MQIHRIDMDNILSHATHESIPRVYMEAFKIQIQKRISQGEHLHLYGHGVEECLYVSDQCWKGLRKCK